MQYSLQTTKKSSRMAMRLAVLAVSTLSTACAVSNETLMEAQRPNAAPVATRTSFSESLRCMDDLYSAYGVRDVRITTKGIPDATGEIQAGTRDMLISAVSQMSARSRAFTFIDFEQVAEGFGPPPDQRLYAQQTRLVAPAYYIRGSVTSFDEGIVSDTIGGGIRVDGTGGGVNFDRTSSVVGVDMNIGEVATGLIVPGVSAQNSIAVSRRSLGGDVSFDVEILGETVGGFMQAARSKSEGMHTALRTLIELNTIESLGRLVRVPYWRCLGIDQSDPRALARSQNMFGSLSQSERIEFVEKSLSSLGYYNGAVDGEMDRGLKDAIGRYQAENGLTATTGINAQLYASLLGKDFDLKERAEPVTSSKAGYQELIKERLFVSVSDEMGLPVYAPGMTMRVNARLNTDAYLYCFYKDARGSVARIFPNRFQPNALSPGGRLIEIPGRQAGFDIFFDTPGATETVTCFASRDEVGTALPENLKVADLTPLPVSSLADLERIIRQSTTEEVAVTTVDFLVK